MNQQKINFISNLFSETLFPVIIADANLEVIWVNDNDFLNKLGTKNLSTIIEFNRAESTCIVPVKIGKLIYNLSILKVTEKGVNEGYVIRFLSMQDTKKLLLNERFINAQLAFFAMIRNNISGIVSTSSLIQSSLEDKEMYDELDYLNLQMNYCYKLLAETVNPSEMAKYFFGFFNKKRLNVGQYGMKITDYINNIIRDPRVNLICKSEDDVIIDIDTDRLLVAVVNIIINSIQYNISETKEVRVSIKKSDEYAAICVTDNGIGMTNEQIEILMDVLQGSRDNIDQSVKIGNGYACGYDVLYNFCEAFSGKVLITSKENEGTTVILRVPLSTGNRYPEHLQSDTANYLMNRFSNVYLLVSKACSIKYI